VLIRFRQHLGKLKDRLENRVVTLSSGKRRGAAALPITKSDEDLFLQWFTGDADDDAMIARARTQPDGRAFIERACTSRPANARMWAARAEFSLEAGELEAALEQAAHAFYLGRFEAEVGLVLVRVRMAAGRSAAALEVIPAVLANVVRMDAHALRLELCRHWQALEPDSIEPLLESARARVAAGQLEDAIAEFEALHAKFGPRTDVLLPLAAIFQDLVRNEDALRAYLQAVEAAPDDVDALCMAGACAHDVKDFVAADKLLGRAFALDPKSPFAQYNLGVLRLDEDRIDEAAGLILGARDLTRGTPWTEEDFGTRLATPVEWDVADVEWANARFKIVHDIEQFEFLRERNNASGLGPVIEEYKRVLLDPLLPADAYSMVALDPRKYPFLSRTFKVPVHAPDREPPAGALINPDLAWKQIEERYFDSKPSLVYIDELFTPGALAAIRLFCLESAIWNQLKGGYLGAYMPDGFSGRLLLRIASELRARMPRVISQHSLQTMWGYKYDSRYAGIGVHADIAAVNVNFWVTPDEANLDPESGGLVVYTHDAPLDWSFRRLNSDREGIYAYLKSVDAQKVKVPHRANRAVIFDSDLFHETDSFQFREGYENRRVNVTMLYGTRAG
jgi:tetratricopeptide (TPR) repeat protein